MIVERFFNHFRGYGGNGKIIIDKCCKMYSGSLFRRRKGVLSYGIFVMSDRMKRAVELHENGANCCQAVLAVFAEKYGLSSNDARRLARGFGGGMRRGEVCGAASGAVMALGLASGEDGEDSEARKSCENRTREFMQWFEKRNGSVLCRELLRAAGGKICPVLVAGVVERLEEMGV